MTSTNTSLPKGVKVSYLRDFDNEDRVLTVVRSFDYETKSVKFGWSLNTPKEWKAVDGVSVLSDGRRVLTTTFTEKKGDQFSKKVGRALALKKMADDTHLAYVSSHNDSPLKAVLRYLIEESDRLELPFSVAKIAKQHVDLIPGYSNKNEEKTAKLPESFLDRMLAVLRGA